MARSLLEKHSKKPLPASLPKAELQVVSRGKSERASDTLTDADWYHIHSFWKSSLFNQQYLRDDFQRIHSRELTAFEDGFQTFLKQFLNLCDQKRDEKFHTWNEDQTVRSWIMPVMEKLGWWNATSDPVIPELTFTVAEGDRKRIYRPDCIFVPAQKVKGAIQEKDPSDRLEFARRYSILTLEAKYWNRIRKYESQDKDLGTKADKSRERSGDSASALSPGGQLLAYLKHLKNDEPVRNHFGIVTDGKIWRLHHADRPEDKFFEFDLGDLFFEITSGKSISDLEGKQYRHIEEAARYFYYLFSKDALFSECDEPTLVEDVYAYSKKYVEKAEQDLKGRFLTAMRHACNGFNRATREAGSKLKLDDIRDAAESHIFNILFLKSCEAKGIIRYEANTDISITSIIERISRFESSDHFDDATNEKLNLKPAFKDFQYKNNGFELHNKIMQLTDIVQNGGRMESGIEISAFKESLFSVNERHLLSKYKLTNIETVKLLFALGYMEEEGKYRQIPYNIFTPEQLGSIYESFLEFKLSQADEDLEFVGGQWRPLSKKTDEKLKHHELIKYPIARSGELFFTPNNKNRKASGSYYTPDAIVKHIVEATLKPLCRGRRAEELLKLRVCDPAMGSGHFLAGALRFLTDRYLEAMEHESAQQYKTLPEAKRNVLDACIFGVDLNPRAVRLAKMALWLETAHSGAKLEKLEDQLLCGDSLIAKLEGYNWAFDWSESIFKQKNFHGFDAVIGNPPWISLSGKFGEDTYSEAQIAYLIKRFNSNTYMPNTYEFFVSQSIELCRSGGMIGLIVPDRLGANDQFANLRKAIAENCKIKELRYKWPFPGITADTLITIMQKEKPLPGSTTVYEYYGSIVQIVSQTSFLKNQMCKFEAPRNAYVRSALEKICDPNKSVPLATLCDTTSGFGGKSKEMSDRQLNRRQIKVIKGASIEPYKVKSFLWFDFCRENITGRTTDTAKLGAKPKVLLRKTGDCLIAAYDETGIFPEQSLYFMFDFKSKDDVFIILAAMNSKVMNFYYNEVAITNKESIAQLKKTDLDKFPIPSMLTKPQREQLTKLVKCLLKNPSDRAARNEIDLIFFDYYSFANGGARAISEYEAA
jgi:type I restriction-modification system DNA methylase subunit